MTKDRVAELDLLRFIAALSVVVYHYGHPLEVGSLTRYTEFGFLGVQLFFMISGFVILWTAMKKTPAEFVISRFSRLYPTFWVCLAMTAAALTVLGQPIGLWRLIANLIMIPGPLGQMRLDDVYWTLVVELKFYALIFFLILARQLIHIRRWLAGWLVFSVLAAFIPKLHSLSFDQLSVYFIAGCYLYLIRTQPRRLDLVALGVCAILGVHNAVGMQLDFTHDASHRAAVWIGTIVLAEYALFLSVAMRWWALPNIGLWGWLGAMTYPLYLVHAGVVANLGRHYLEPYGRFWIMLTVALLLALGLAATIERKGCHAVNAWLLRPFSRKAPAIA